jgi:hypothetical protein
MRVAEPTSDLDTALGALARPDLDPEKAEAIRHQAHAILAGHRTPWGRLRLASSEAYERVLEPTLVSTLAAGYLLWALASAAFLLGWRL